MKKREYETPEFEAVVLLAQDVLTVSDDDDNQGEWDELFAEE